MFIGHFLLSIGVFLLVFGVSMWMISYVISDVNRMIKEMTNEMRIKKKEEME